MVPCIQMAPNTPIPLITVDPKKKPWEQEKPLHNRWHPDIPAVSTGFTLLL